MKQLVGGKSVQKCETSILFRMGWRGKEDR